MKSEVFQLNIISPVKKIFSGEVSSMIAPGISGLFGVYPDHASMITALKKGELHYKIEGGDHSLKVEGGVLEVKDNIVTVCIQ